MKSYLDLLRYVREHGVRKKSRPVLQSTGQAPDTFAVFGATFRHDLALGFPLLTTKKTSFHNILHENLWFLRGESSTQYLQDHGVKIWDQWAKDGDVGPVYGVQWRRWQAVDANPEPLARAAMSVRLKALRTSQFYGPEMQAVASLPDVFQTPERLDRDVAQAVLAASRKSIDQLANVVKTLRTNPSDRRMVVSAWNPADLAQMGLPACHMLFQFGVIEDRLNCLMMQRSADIFLGVPYNIAGYALLTHLIAHVTGFKPGELMIAFGDLHIYENHLEQVDEQLTRAPHPLPQLVLDPTVKELDDFQAEHVRLEGYQHHPALRAEVAV